MISAGDSEPNGGPPRQEFVDDAAERVDVRRGVDRLAAGLLRRQVGGRAEGDAADRLLRLAGGLGEPKVDQLDGVLGGEHQVLRLDVEVHQIASVEVVERVGDLLQESGGFRDRKRTATLQFRLERTAGHELDHDPRGLVVLVQVVDAGDVWVGEEGHRPRLAAEAGTGVRIAPVLGAQRLQRHLAPRAEIAAAVDHGHPARAERLGKVDVVVSGDDRSRPITPRVRGGIVEGHLWCGRYHPLLYGDASKTPTIGVRG